MRNGTIPRNTIQLVVSFKCAVFDNGMQVHCFLDQIAWNNFGVSKDWGFLQFHFGILSFFPSWEIGFCG